MSLHRPSKEEFAALLPVIVLAVFFCMLWIIAAWYQPLLVGILTIVNVVLFYAGVNYWFGFGETLKS